jgi:hypothetical protein
MRQLENNAKQGGVKGNAAGNELGMSQFMKHRNTFDKIHLRESYFFVI